MNDIRWQTGMGEREDHYPQLKFLRGVYSDLRSFFQSAVGVKKQPDIVDRCVALQTFQSQPWTEACPFARLFWIGMPSVNTRSAKVCTCTYMY